VQASQSVTQRADERWTTDIALIWCGEKHGWFSIVPVLDCCPRPVYPLYP